MSDRWEDPRERRARLAKELDLFAGLRRRAKGQPEPERSEHQKAMDQARSDAERRKPRS